MPKKTPMLTIIIPALNEEATLGNLLEDLAGQTTTSFAVIVVDGQSEDRTVAIARSYSTRLSIQVLSSKKRNAGTQRNLGGQHASTPYVLFLDADDRIDATFIEELEEQIAVTQTDAFTTYARPDSTDTQDTAYITFQNVMHDLFAKIKRPFAFGACIGCRRTVFTSLHGFDDTILYMEDTEFVTRLVEHGYTFTVFREPTYVYSLRRFRKDGALQIALKSIPHYIQTIILKNPPAVVEHYPMLGGTYFTDTHKKTKS